MGSFWQLLQTEKQERAKTQQQKEQQSRPSSTGVPESQVGRFFIFAFCKESKGFFPLFLFPLSSLVFVLSPSC